MSGPKLCGHGALSGRCPLCQRYGDPTTAADRVIRDIRIERHEARAAAWAVRSKQSS
ncbi:MAG: hypothetical protein JWP34_4529 [Massilia sp.]|nr:hypothetical protein [Gemmatimonadales bacterium]MDB5910415.1 hypothetical protein [Massilia sp.]